MQVLFVAQQSDCLLLNMQNQKVPTTALLITGTACEESEPIVGIFHIMAKLTQFSTFDGCNWMPCVYVSQQKMLIPDAAGMCGPSETERVAGSVIK